ncbi:hypothetical protein CAPTEDRAFT_84912, partial [Capitella teleta]
IKFQVSVTTRDYTGKTALHYCVENMTSEIAELIFDEDSSLLEIKDNEGYTALQLAVIAANVPVINFLLEKGADINSVDTEGHTVIHWATGQGHTACTETLIKKGAEINSTDKNGCSALFYAITLGHLDCAKLLL